MGLPESLIDFICVCLSMIIIWACLKGFLTSVVFAIEWGPLKELNMNISFTTVFFLSYKMDMIVSIYQKVWLVIVVNEV